MNKALLAAGALGFAGFAAPVLAQDVGVTVTGGVGVIYLNAVELVYNDPGDSRIASKLIWETTAPMLSASMDVRLPQGWTVALAGRVALSGDSYMEDYDWLSGDFSADQWSERSLHPDTRLDWYVDGSMFVGHDFGVAEGVTVNVNAGFKYIDVKWGAYGGSYIYSDAGFRDDIGSFPDGDPVIRYRTQVPALQVGVDTTVVKGPWTVAVAAKGGFTVHARDRDDHVLRALVFDGSFDVAPAVSLALRTDYAVSDGLSLFVSGSVDSVFSARGNTVLSGSDTGFVPDSAGTGMITAAASAGLKGSF